MFMMLPESMRGGSGYTAPAVVVSKTYSSVTIAKPSPSPSGSVATWGIEYRELPGGEWATYATGLTDATKTVNGLSAETSYEFRTTAQTIIQLIGTTTATTDAQVGPPLVPWAQIDGGQDFGSVVDGGSTWFWNNAGPATFEAWFKNPETATIDALQIPVEAVSETPGTMLGYAVQRDGVWQVDGTDVTPPSGGTWDYPKIALSPVMVLNSPIAPAQYTKLQQTLSAGLQTPGKNFGDQYHPETGTTGAANFELGDHLGTDITPVGIAIGPFPTRLFMRLVDAQLYAMGMFGDSTVGMVQPVDSPTTNSKEGVWFWANAANRTLGKNVRAYSYGQGTSQWSSIQARVRANLASMQGKISRVCIQVWTWNSPWGFAEQAEAAWAEYLALEAEVKAAGFACSPLILHPYTTKTDPGQIAAFAALKAHVVAHPEGIALDEITGSTSWPNLPSAESEDNVHQNQTGSKRCAAAVAAALLSVAATDYPELA